MSKNRRQYSEEFKREAVRLMTEGGVPLAQVSRDLGVCTSVACAPVCWASGSELCWTRRCPQFQPQDRQPVQRLKFFPVTASPVMKSWLAS